VKDGEEKALTLRAWENATTAYLEAE